jgi:hypothetical protein
MTKIELVIITMVLFCFSPTEKLYASDSDLSYRIFNRLNGVPPSKDEQNAMIEYLKAGKKTEAIGIALESRFFYNLTLKNWITPWTNEGQTTQKELNDFTATAIGFIRDDFPFDKILYGETLFIGDSTLLRQEGLSVPDYNSANNLHYQDLENKNIDLKKFLKPVQQSMVTNLDVSAGILTSRAFGDSFYRAGTNRAALRFALMNFLCRDLEDLHDNTRPDYKIRKDVDRSPGGDSTLFRNRCAGCHAGMDSLAGGFAYMDFVDSKIIHTKTTVRPKNNQNSDIYPDGFETLDDKWENLWSEGSNKKIGWPAATKGAGVKSLGRHLAGTDAFAVCMARKVFRLVCLNEPDSKKDEIFVNSEATRFKGKGKYKMKPLFLNAADYCIK